jgi:hypothetical protein
MERDIESSRSLPFFETMRMEDESEDGRRWSRSIARRENIRLRCAEILAYVESAVCAI